MSSPKPWDRFEEGISDREDLSLQRGLTVKFPGEVEKGGLIPHPAPLPTCNSGKLPREEHDREGSLQ